MQSFDHEGNPLRLNNFATALRELGRIHLELQAPDERVKSCDWFEQKFNELGKPVIERAQRAKYAIQGELLDQFVEETLGIEIRDVIRDYTRLISHLSAYTHITPKTFDIPTDEAVEQAERALEVFDQLFTFVRERRETMRKAAEDAAQEALRDVLYGEVNEELDRLSTHTSVEGVELYSLRITAMDAETICYSGRGNVDVHLQYGSRRSVLVSTAGTGAQSFISAGRLLTASSPVSVDCTEEADPLEPEEMNQQLTRRATPPLQAANCFCCRCA